MANAMKCLISSFIPRACNTTWKKAIPRVFNDHMITRRFSVSPHLHARKFTEKHEWISVDGKIGKVGISNYAQEALGEVVFINFPEPGTFVEKDGDCGALESVKAVSEMYSPVTGKVIEYNEILVNEPNRVNTSCYDDGWIYKIELSDHKELDSLMDEVVYEEYLKSIEK